MIHLQMYFSQQRITQKWKCYTVLIRFNNFSSPTWPSSSMWLMLQTHLFCLALKVTSCRYDKHPRLKGQRPMNSRLYQHCFPSTEEVGRKTRTDLTLISPVCCRAGIDPKQFTNNEPSSFWAIRGVKFPENELLGGCMNRSSVLWWDGWIFHSLA